MIKRNDGYALVYVLVVLLVLVALSMAVTTISLHNLESQRASIDRMTEKYEAQGQVEQIIGQLEHAEDEGAQSIIAKFIVANDESPTSFPYIDECDDIPEAERPQYEIIGQSGNTKVTARIKLKPREKTDTVTDSENNETQVTKTVGHEVIYLSYKTEVTP